MRDLADIAVKMTRESEVEKVREQAEHAAENRVLDILLPAPRRFANEPADEEAPPDNTTREKFRVMLREGKLDDKLIEVELNTPSIGVEIMAPPGMEEMTSQLQGMFQSMSGNRKSTRELRVKDALKHLGEEEAGKLINEDDIIHVITRESTGKVKRLRNNQQVRIVPCSFKGEPCGEWISGKATMVQGNDAETVIKLRKKKYGFKALLSGFITKSKGNLVVYSISLD